MSSSDWRSWCNESLHRELQYNLTALDAWSFTAITLYAVVALVAAVLWVRWLQLSDSCKSLLWPGFKWFVPPAISTSTPTLIDTQSPSDSDKLLPYDCVAALLFASSSHQVPGASSCRLHLRLLEQRWLSWRQSIRVPHVPHGRLV